MDARLAKTLTVILLTVLVAPLLTPAPLPAQSGPFKIGMLAPLTGPFAQTGKDMGLKYKETSEGGLAANLVLC